MRGAKSPFQASRDDKRGVERSWIQKEPTSQTISGVGGLRANLAPDAFARWERLNSRFLDLVEPKVRMLLRWQKDLDEVRSMVAWLGGRLEELRGEFPDAPGQALSVLMQEAMERASSTGYRGLVTSNGDDPPEKRGV
jgi:hypothetical protein